MMGILYLLGKDPIRTSKHKTLCLRRRYIRIIIDIPSYLQNNNGSEIKNIFKIIIITKSISLPKEIFGNLDKECLDSTQGRASSVSKFFHELSLLDNYNKLRGKACVSYRK